MVEKKKKLDYSHWTENKIPTFDEKGTNLKTTAIEFVVVSNEYDGDSPFFIFVEVVVSLHVLL